MAVIIDNNVFQLPDRSYVQRGLAHYGNARNRYEERIDKIEEEYGKLKLPESWKEGNEIQKKYYDMFQQAADNFSRKGMPDDADMQQIEEARRYFAKYMVPIKEAVNRYNTVSDLITKAGGDAIVGNGSKLTLEEIYKNGAVHDPLRTISRTQVVNGASQYFKGIENLLAKDPSFKVFEGRARGYLEMTRKGFNEDEVLTMALSDYMNNSNSPESDAVRKYADSYIKGLNVGDFDNRGMAEVRGATVDGIVRSFMQDTRRKIMGDQSIAIDQRERAQRHSEYVDDMRLRQGWARINQPKEEKLPTIGGIHQVIHNGRKYYYEYITDSTGEKKNLKITDDQGHVVGGEDRAAIKVEAGLPDSVDIPKSNNQGGTGFGKSNTSRSASNVVSESPEGEGKDASQNLPTERPEEGKTISEAEDAHKKESTARRRNPQDYVQN